MGCRQRLVTFSYSVHAQPLPSSSSLSHPSPFFYLHLISLSEEFPIVSRRPRLCFPPDKRIQYVTVFAVMPISERLINTIITPIWISSWCLTGSTPVLKTRPTAYICGWRQKGHSAIKTNAKSIILLIKMERTPWLGHTL